MKLTLSTSGIDHKPTSDEYRRRIYQMKIFETDKVENLFYLIAHNGYSYRDCVCNGTHQNDFICQEIITLDFDNGFSMDQFGELCVQYGIMPNVIYHTFSHSESHEKFRAVFFLNETINELMCAKALKRCINYLFSEADQIKNVAQVYQGSNKTIEYFNADNRIGIIQIMNLACQALKKNEGAKNYGRNRKSLFLLETDILKILKKVPSPNIYYNAGQNFEEKIKFIEPKVSDVEVEEDKHFDWNLLDVNCKLYHNSITGEHWITEPELFFLMSGLKNKRGSASRLNKIINIQVDKHPQHYDLAVIKARKERIKTCEPMYRRCQEICPYYKKCKVQSLETVKNGIVQRLEEYKPIELSEAEQHLSNAMNTAWNDQKDISIIKCDTGVGKTEIMKQFIESHSELNVCIAVPTHKLAEEIKHRIHKNFTAISELNLNDLEPELATEYKKYSICGKYSEAYKVLLSSRKMPIIRYLIQKDAFEKGNMTNVIITHTRFFQCSNLNHYDIVFVDEDAILKSMNTVQVKKDEFFKSVSNDVLDWIKQVDFGLNELKKLTETKIKEIMDAVYGLSFNLNDVLHSDLCYSSDDCYYFSKMNNFPSAKKIIMMSATVNDSIASKYCYSRKKTMEFYEIPKVKLKGKLLQFTDMPSSRTALSEDTINKFRNCIAVSLDPEASIVTFCKFKRELEKSGYEISATFGALEGLDSMNGKNINVIGTYRISPQLYLMFAKSLWGEIETRHEKQSYQIHTFNGFRFKMMSPEHHAVREVMFYMILSESIQAVGRARLTRNEEAKVTLFSKLPLKEAKIYSEI